MIVNLVKADQSKFKGEPSFYVVRSILQTASYMVDAAPVRNPPRKKTQRTNPTMLRGAGTERDDTEGREGAKEHMPLALDKGE